MGVEKLFEAIASGNAGSVPELIEAELEAGTSPGLILKDGMISAMELVGSQFEQGEVYVPEMLIAARAMQAGLSVLKPHLIEEDIPDLGRVVIGTVQGDLHDIGKNLVAMMLEGAGFEVLDLGTDVSPVKFVGAVDDNTDIVAMSALLTTTMPQMDHVIEALTEAGLRNRLKIMIGGAPVTQVYADQIGADAFAPDAGSAARMAKQVLGVG
jgi:5-methyltetrahydrofolate--homocysteine methyltransferase